MADKKTSLSPAKNIFKDQRVLLAIVIALIVVIISCINPNFIGINNIVAIFQQICVLGILTMAMSILLISGGIDLSIGNIMVVCGVVMYVVLDNGLPTFIAVLAGLVTGAACGLLNGAIIAKSKCIPLVITLGTSKMFYGIALTVWTYHELRRCIQRLENQVLRNFLAHAAGFAGHGHGGVSHDDLHQVRPPCSRPGW